jgi:hypothetical protein
MNKRQFGLILLICCVSLVGGPAGAENRFVTQEAVDMVERRQDTMARMLEALGYGSVTNAEPGIWSLPRAFERRYGLVRTSLTALESAIEREDAVEARSSLCALVRACGECHAAYRVIDTESLIREGVSWLGQYPGCVRRY